MSWPVLSVTVFLPLVGARFIMARLLNSPMTCRRISVLNASKYRPRNAGIIL